ncbi:HlyD family secretion protein [Roseivivax sp. CAU 1753]
MIRSGALARLLLLAGVAGLSGCLPGEDDGLPGYVEGDFVTIAPRVPGRIVQIAVSEGDTVRAGQLLFRLDLTEAKLNLAQARAQVAEADAMLANLTSGGRPEEIHPLEAAIAALEAEYNQAKSDLDRARTLFDRGIISEAQFNAARSGMERGAARLEEARANLDLATGPSRSELIEAQRQRMSLARAQRDLAEWQLAERSVSSPAAGTIETLIRHPGEQAAPLAPVLTMLPEDAVFVIFFVSEVERGTLQPGREVGIACEGCGAGQTARVVYIAGGPEFTPPVIFSESRAQKLTYRVKAIPTRQPNRLKPGQIVSVTLSDAVD